MRTTITQSVALQSNHVHVVTIVTIVNSLRVASTSEETVKKGYRHWSVCPLIRLAQGTLGN